MRVVIQRVSRASVKVDQSVVGAIELGLLLLVGFGPKDTEATLSPIGKKIAEMRLFPDEKDRLHLSVLDIRGGILVVPQFTLYADILKGRRPDFIGAMEPKQANILYEKFLTTFQKIGVERVERGAFGANMQVELLNDGPVTILLDSDLLLK